MALSILEMVVPVILMFLLGWLCRKKRILSAQGHQGIKSLVSSVLLPFVLFHAFFTAEYSGKIALTLGTFYVSCALGLGAGFLLRRLAAPRGRFLPFLVTNFEGGMMGYALFGLLYPGKTSVFAMADIGQTLAAFTFFMVCLQAVGRGKSDPRALVRDAVRNPVLIGILLGIILGTAGVGQTVLNSSFGKLYSDTVSFLTAPVSGLILVIVGYELSFSKSLLRPVLVTVLLRLLVSAALLGFCRLVIFSVIPFEKPLFTAVLLAWCLPAPYIIPLYAASGEDGEYISTTLSIQTVVSILLFIGVAAYSLS